MNPARKHFTYHSGTSPTYSREAPRTPFSTHILRFCALQHQGNYTALKFHLNTTSMHHVYS